MRLAIDPSGAPGASLKDLTRRLIAKTMTGLDKADAAANGFQSQRRSLKKLRSILLLGAGTLPEPALKSAVRGIAAFGRQLSGARDLAVLHATLAQVDAHYPEAPLAPVFATPLKVLFSAHTSPKQATLNRDFRRVSAAVDALPLEALGRADIALGFGITYRDARQAMKRARASRLDEPMHDWRKAAQRHWRQLQILKPIWPQAFAAPQELANELCEGLGCYQDLSVLRAAAARLDAPVPAATIELLLARCTAQQTLLREAAMPVGSLLFVERPKAIRERLLCIWEPATLLWHSDDAEIIADKSGRKSGTSKSTDWIATG
jgi:CHAD domain